MAIGFARIEFVQRSAGKTACGKSAYNAREKIQFQGTKFAESKTYDWSYKEKTAFHEVILPNHVDRKFTSLDILWNTVEQKENRSNSQVAMEMVLALPDDKVISLEDKIELTKTFVLEHFTKHGLAVQINIHRPDKKIFLTMSTGEVDGFDHNWHAHILIPTRRFHENGQELDDHKARDLMPVVRDGRVVAGLNWGKLWTQHQNQFFEDKGLDLRVDETGIVSQKHLGPIRLRGRAFALEEENQILTSMNHMESKDPTKILEKITQTRSVFSVQDVERYLQKHLDRDEVDIIRDAFWNQDTIVQLIDHAMHEPTSKFSTREVVEEEKQILRLADLLQATPNLKFKSKGLEQCVEKLNAEQKRAFDHIIHGNKLCCIEGHAGTGKSYLLTSLREYYLSQGFSVRAFGPDNATSDLLAEKGFDISENIYRFLFSLHHGKREITQGKEVWIFDESSKLGNQPLLEFLKAAEKHQAQVIFAGCSSQLPSVERGGLFKTFCERYGAQELIEIQRQKKETQRAMTQNLAHGKMAAAIDQLSRLHGLKWHETKEDAIEALIKMWAVDQTYFPNSSALILAHTNAEVRVLNEMTRLYRKEKGELSREELVCKTPQGKFIVSVGDKIEFRVNNKDLGITNGMRGTLINASPDRFEVALLDETRKISFHPEEYTGFQLGYATTYFRSQGQTVERAYVLHSPQMNKEKFYVGLTRHVHKAVLFISRTEVANIADLKRQAFRKNMKENTLDYLTLDQLKMENSLLDRKQQIKELMDSSLIGKAKGYALDKWDSIKSSVQEKLQHTRDLKPNRTFFNPNVNAEDGKGLVVKIDEQHLNFEPYRQLNVQKTFSKISEKAESLCTVIKETKNQQINANWEKLSSRNKDLMDKYYQHLNQESSLNELVRSEAAQNDLKNAPHFCEWQKACGVRNAQAFEILKAIPRSFIKEAIGQKPFEILMDRALKHEASVQRQNDQHVNLVEELKERLELLLQNLFPEGPTGRDRKGLRFGSKGSLAVICQGSQAGCYYDFERGEGGGPLQLIQHKLSLNVLEGKEWAKNFLGQTTNIQPSSQFKLKQRFPTQTREWISLKPDSAHQAPLLKNLSNVLNQKYHEVARHAYCNESGELLFYTLRLSEHENADRKCVLPLSFGKWQGSEHAMWSLKSYQSENRTLYNLHLLVQKPLAKVLIVEGEKTADAAQALFVDNNVVCVTWQGGASAVTKSLWRSLHGRDVVIWPDNDEAGFKAANTLINQLRKVGVSSLSVVDKEDLIKFFPEKWDLADPYPLIKGVKNANDMILIAKEKSIGIDKLEMFVKSKVEGILEEKMHAQELLWRVEERCWNFLEEKYGSRIWEIKQAILEEVHSLLSYQESAFKKIQSEEQLNDKFAARLVKQMALQQAEQGKPSSRDQIEEIKQIMRVGAKEGLNTVEPSSLHNRETFAHAIDRSFAEVLSFGRGIEICQKKFRTGVKENFRNIYEQTIIHDQKQTHQQALFRQRHNSLDNSL